MALTNPILNPVLIRPDTIQPSFKQKIKDHHHAR